MVNIIFYPTTSTLDENEKQNCYPSTAQGGQNDWLTSTQVCVIISILVLKILMNLFQQNFAQPILGWREFFRISPTLLHKIEKRRKLYICLCCEVCISMFGPLFWKKINEIKHLTHITYMMPMRLSDYRAVGLSSGSHKWKCDNCNRYSFALQKWWSDGIEIRDDHDEFLVLKSSDFEI